MLRQCAPPFGWRGTLRALELSFRHFETTEFSICCWLQWNSWDLQKPSLGPTNEHILAEGAVFGRCWQDVNRKSSLLTDKWCASVRFTQARRQLRTSASASGSYRRSNHHYNVCKGCRIKKNLIRIKKKFNHPRIKKKIKQN